MPIWWNIINYKKELTINTPKKMDESQKHEKIKETRHEEFHIVWIHLQETSRKGKTVEIGKWLSEARVGVQRGIENFLV